MSTRIRWGILGPGRIAAKFAQGLKALPDAELLAVGSRAAERAEAFAEQFGAPRRYGSYEELAAEKGLTVPQTAMAYVLNQPMNVFPLIGAASGAELQASIDAAKVKLTPEQLAWLDLQRDSGA